MATYTICDICGSKTGIYLYSLELRNATDPTDYEENGFECDLCKDCAKSVKDFIKKERKANWHIDKELE